MKKREKGFGTYVFVGFVSASLMLLTLRLCYTAGLSELSALLLSLAACLLGAVLAFALSFVFDSILRRCRFRRADAISRRTHMDMETRSGSRTRRL